MQILAWTVRANLPAIGIWLTLYGLQLSSVERKTAASDKRPQPEQVPNGLRWVMIVVFLFGFTVGVGAWPGSTTRCGWGLSPDLELSLLQHALADLPLDGSSHCSGVRESGMLAWLRPGEIRPYDVPERAFLAGRLKEHVRISDDLRAGWADRHRRGDGTWGGWWIPLAQRNTRLLLISPRDTECVRSLESSNWKPLAIDAPCLPYGLAGDPALGNRMVQMLALLDLVEHGAWSYPAPPAGGAGHYVDLCGWFTGQHNVQLDLQQSRTMEAMQRHLAAIRVLQYALQRSCQEAREAYQRNQLALAYQEQLQVGRASRWRTLAYLGSGGNIRTAVELFGSETLPPSSDPTTRNWQQAVKAALAGDLQSAIEELPEHEDESLYAKSQLYLEAGEPARAAALFRRLIVEFPESMCATLARTTLGLRHE